MVDYQKIISEKGHFLARLDSNQSYPGILDTACADVAANWVLPMLNVAQRAAFYMPPTVRTISAPKPPIVPPITASSSGMAELMIKEASNSLYGPFYEWALRHATLLMAVPLKGPNGREMATESWDPSVLMNLNTVVPRAAITWARARAREGSITCLFRHDAYSIHAVLFGVGHKLLTVYDVFVLECQFILKDLERELRPLRRARTAQRT